MLHSIGLGKSQGLVDCPAKEALAWWSMPTGRENMRICKENGDPARLILTEHTPHDVEYTVIKKMPFPLYNRCVPPPSNLSFSLI
jgi:hypothetical protein